MTTTGVDEDPNSPPVLLVGEVRRTVTGRARVTGTVVQHLARDGTLLFEWSPFDHLSPEDLAPADRAGPEVNWTHGNALDLAPDGTLLVFFRSLSEITALDTRTGAVLWRLGGRANQFGVVGGEPPWTAFDHVSPRASVLWTPDAATSLYASVGRGTEVPILGELSASPGAQLRTSLRPKSLWNYEVGGRRVIGGRALLEGAVFFADVRGEFVPITVDGTTVPENASRSRNVGVELALTGRITRRLELAASYAFLDLRLREYSSIVLDATGAPREVDFSGKLLPAVPRHRVTGEARVRPVGAADLGVQVEWQSVVYVETGNARTGTWYFQPAPGAPVQAVPFRAVPARALVHLNGSWRLGPVTLFGSVENLFGVEYAGSVVANEFAGRFYEAGSPRRGSLGLRLTTNAR